MGLRCVHCDAGQLELTHRYLWGSQTDQLLADEQVDNANSSAEVYWPLTDHLGTIRDIVEYIEEDNANGDDIGTMVEKHRFYDSFGVLRAERTRGDFNNNGVYDSEDIDALFALVGTEQFNEQFDDLDGDGDVDDADVDILIEQVINTVYGDGTLDGVVDISDFSVWNTHKFTNGDGWDTGDYNGDGVVDISDFAEWSANKWTSNSEFDLELTKHQFGYTGRLFDEVTGLQNNLNRWYDPELGRWISEDPIGFAGGDANLHRYVGNGATTHIDPTGLALIVNDTTRSRLQWEKDHPRLAKLRKSLEEMDKNSFLPGPNMLGCPATIFGGFGDEAIGAAGGLLDDAGKVASGLLDDAVNVVDDFADDIFKLFDEWLPKTADDAIETGLKIKDKRWPWHGLHQVEKHHPLMQGKTFKPFWKQRGFKPTEIDNWTVPIDKDIHQAFTNSKWWDDQLISRTGRSGPR